MRKKKLLFIVVVLLLCQTGFSQSGKRLVSLAPSVTKMIYLLHGQNNLVGCTSYCEQAKKDHKAIVASAVDVNVEKIILLKPTVVIATGLTRPATIESLRKVGIPVLIFYSPKTFDDLCNQFNRLGELTGKQLYAQNLIRQQRSRLNILAHRSIVMSYPKVFIEVGAKPLFAAIPNTFIDNYLFYSHGQNIAWGLKSGSISREAVLLRNPDAILIVTMGVVGQQEKQKWESYKGLNAVRRHKIFALDADMMCSPTPVDFVNLVAQITKLIH